MNQFTETLTFRFGDVLGLHSPALNPGSDSFAQRQIVNSDFSLVSFQIKSTGGNFSLVTASHGVDTNHVFSILTLTKH